MNARNHLSSRRSARLSVLGAAAAAACFLAPAATPPQGGDIEGARDLLQRWVETRRQISKAKQDWAVGREMLESRIDLVAGEIEALRGKIAGIEQQISDAERKQGEFESNKRALQETSDALAARVIALEKRVSALLARLPAPLAQKVRPISQSLPADPDTADRGKLGERFLTVLGILNEVNKYNREIRVESEIRSLSDGSTVEVATVYVGIGQAYFASADGRVAGYGSPAVDGWTWTEANEHSAEIVRAIAILEKGADADFVNLPIRIQ